jgi:uncharacterized membrane protein (DUF4010 family)
MAIFNFALFLFVYPYFLILIVISIALGLFFWYKARHTVKEVKSELTDKNPLEFKVAIIFTLLYLGFTFLTYFTIRTFGTGGLNTLSYMVGFTDIDPFLLNLFQGKFSIGSDAIARAIMQAIISNNVLKYVYAISLGSKHNRLSLTIGFGAIVFVNLIIIFLI